MGDYQHYIRIVDGLVTHGYTTGFETPQDGDIMIDSNGPRHFQIQLMNERGQYKYKYVNGQLIDRTQDPAFVLDNAKTDKADSLRAIATTELQTFPSSALGSVHTYLSGTNDMILLNAEYTFVKSDDFDNAPIIWFTIESGNVQHTPAQFVQVYLEGRNHVAQTKYKLAQLEAQIAAVTSIDQLDAITW